MKTLRWLAPAVLSAVMLAASPGTSPAKVTVAKDGNCKMKITFNLEFYGPGGDSAFAQAAKTEIETCWSGKKIGCCPVSVVVNFKIGSGGRTAGYDSIYVYDDSGGGEDDHISSCHLGTVNGGDSDGTWDNNEPNNTFAHEVGHLAGLPDTYKEGKNPDGSRKTTPCAGHANDKMAQLGGGITQAAIQSLVTKAGLTCPKNCWPTTTPGGATTGGGDTGGPVKRPSEGTSNAHINISPSGGLFLFYPAVDTGADSAFVPGVGGFIDVYLDTIPEPELNPTYDPQFAGLTFQTFHLDIPSFEWSPGVFTGPNQLDLTGMDPEAPNVGMIDDVTGEFAGTLQLVLTNNLFPPTDPRFITTPIHGQIFYQDGFVQFMLPVSPFTLAGGATGFPGNPGGDVPRPTLAQNFPNPFRSTTVIRFELPRPEMVSVRVYDPAGRLVRTLLDGPRDGGLTTLTWDRRDAFGREAVPGVYFYTLSTSDRRFSRRMILLP